MDILRLEHGGEAGMDVAKYSSRVQLAATERSAVCQVCMWALINPGSTKWRCNRRLGAIGRELRRDRSDTSSSISTSPVGSTPSLGSCVTTMPDFSRSWAMAIQPVAHFDVVGFERHAGSAGQLKQQHGEVGVAGYWCDNANTLSASPRRSHHHTHAWPHPCRVPCP